MNGNRKEKASPTSEERLLIVLVAILVALVLLVIVGGTFLYFQFKKSTPVGAISAPGTSIRVSEPGEQAPVERKSISVFFLATTHLKLVSESREIIVSKTLAQMAKASLNLLFSGPESNDLKATISQEAQVLATFYQPDEKRMYVDLNATFFRKIPGHTLSEWAAIYSVVNTVCSLSENIESVAFLEEGKPVEQSTGNWDWRRPFYPELAWTQFTRSDSDIVE